MTDDSAWVDAPAIKTVGRYELLREIGRGGMATVYLARQVELDRFVAIKELGSFHASDPTLARRFLRESRLAGSFAHTNIVTVFDYFEDAGTPYIAMEYIEGGSLRPYVGSMTLAQVGGVLEGTLAGLAHAQERNVVHRDLKPENVMVTVEGRVKIADFGIAKATDRVRGASVLTQTGMTVGTPMYMAPEQAMGQDIGPWTDLYSVGCMAFEFFAGRVPFDDEAPMAILLKHINEQPPALAAVAPDVDPQVAEWVAELLVKDVTKRPASANEVWMRFEEILIGRLGPRWRRDARLLGVPGSEGGSPLTPAPFKREQGGPLSVSIYESFDWSSPPSNVPGPATPLPYDAPPGPLVPREVDVPVGPPTPEPLEIVEPPEPEPVSAPEPAETDAQDAFRTYVPEPPPAPPARELDTPPDLHRAEEPEPAASETPTVEPVHSAETAMPLRPPEHGPPEPAERPRRRLRLVAGGGIVAAGVLAAAVAVLSGGSKDGPTATPKQAAGGTVVAAGPLRVTATGGWKPLDQPLEVKGLELAGAGGAAPEGDPDKGVVLVGTADESAHRADLLPPAFVESLGLRDDVTPERTEVTLGGDVPAYRYADLRPLGFGRFLTVYAAPTTAGVATIACVRPVTAVGGDDFAARCGDVAETLSLAGAEAFPLGPVEGYADAVEAALVALNRGLRRDRAALRSARTPGRQANAAGAIATDYGRARDALPAPADVSPADTGAHARVVGALDDTGEAWKDLARAAKAKRRGAYASASRDARRSERAVASAFAALRGNGYARLISTTYRPAAIPALRRERRDKPRPAPTVAPRPGPTAAPPRPAPTAAPPRPVPTAAPPRPVPTTKPPPAPTRPPVEGGG